MAAESGSRPRRVDVGFAGGQVLTMRLAEDVYEELRKVLESGSGGRWHDLQSEDSRIQIDLAQVVYVRLDTERERIGF